MSMPLNPPYAITGSYQNSQMADGVYFAGGSQVFSHLVNPPVSGVAAELASDDAGAAVGFPQTPGAAVNEVQTVTVAGTPTGGAFPLSFRGKTASVAFDDTGATVQTKLTALTTVGAGNATVTGSAGGPYTVTFIGALAARNVPRLSAVPTGLTGGTNVTVTVAQTTPGRPLTTAAGANTAASNSYQQRDPMRDFYDSASQPG